MARAQEDNRSLRFGRADTARLVAALLLSACLHVTIWGSYHVLNRLDLWHRLHLPAWRHTAKPVQVALKPKEKTAKEEAPEEPNIFVDVSQADADTPTKTKYYSDRSSRAANPDVANANAPKIAGTQRDVPKTETATRPVKAPTRTAAPATPANPEQPAPDRQPTANPPNQLPTPSAATALRPPEPTREQTPAEPSPNSLANLAPGETDLRPKPVPVSPPAVAASTPPPRPRTIREALAQNDQLPGLKMQQDGGVARHALSSSLDVKGTPFGEYDRAMVSAISQRWYDLLDRHRFADDRSGKVTLRFKLKLDGTVIEMQTIENTVGDLLAYLCQESIEESAPFAKWPPDMVRMVGANYREVTFTFYYY